MSPGAQTRPWLWSWGRMTASRSTARTLLTCRGNRKPTSGVKIASFDPVGHFARECRQEVVGGKVDHGLACLDGSGAGVGQHEGVVQLQDRVVRVRRLLFEDIERRARDRARAQSPYQRRLVDHGPARGVDQIGGRLHQRQLPVAYESGASWRWGRPGA